VRTPWWAGARAMTKKARIDATPEMLREYHFMTKSGTILARNKAYILPVKLLEFTV
jgi:hypothetical protein